MELDLEGEFLPYEQLPDESSRDWRLFVVYRDLGPRRSLSAAAQAAGVNRRNVHQASADHDWRGRARAWDAEMDRVHRAAMLESQKTVIAEHKELARAMREAARNAIAAIDELTADEACRWVQAAVKIEAAAYAAPPVQPPPVEEKTAADIYFENLSDVKLVKLGREAVTTLEHGNRDHQEKQQGRR